MLRSGSLPSLVAFAAILLGASSAAADVMIAVDGNAAIGVGERSRDNPISFGGDLRLGYEIDFDVVRLTPEVGGGAWLVLRDTDPFVRAFGGLRFGIGEDVVPSIYARVGAAFDGVDDLEPGFLAEGGFALDIELNDTVRIGGQAAFGGVIQSRHNEWIVVGPHLELVF